jgi:lipoate-protein ligase A
MRAWRVLPLQTWDAPMAMALDEAASESVGRGDQPPTVRFWRWKPSAVSIGCFQSLEEEVNLQRCAELGVAYVRRRTGGGAVYHDYDGEITYSVIAPEEHMPHAIHDSYRLICGWLIDGLAEVGLRAEFKPINDVQVNGRKISGNAMTRRNGVVWQHGTVLHSLDVAKMFSLLRVTKEKVSDKLIASVEERVTSVSAQSPGTTYAELYQALYRGFTKGKEFKPGGWSGAELERAKQLAASRYSAREWNFSR